MFDPYVEHVWSLCNGKTPVDEIIAQSRLGDERTVSILMTLRRLGAIVLADDSAERVAKRVADYEHTRSESSGVHVLPTSPTTRIARGSEAPPVTRDAPPITSDAPPIARGSEPPRRARGSEAPPIAEPHGPVADAGAQGPLAAGSVKLEPLSQEQVEIVAEATDLSADEKQRAIAMWRIVGRGDPYEILNAAPGASAVELQAAYRTRCKQFHPDRYYGRDLGSFSRWLAEIFDGIQAAYGKISSLTNQSSFQTKTEHAAELFELACHLEANSKLEDALRMFAAACRVDGKPAHLRRAARCALSAGFTDRAEYWALGAVDLESNDPSTLRLLADVYRAQDRLVRAEVVLKRAIELATGSETLAVELSRDLDRVQAWLRR